MNIARYPFLHLAGRVAVVVGLLWLVAANLLTQPYLRAVYYGVVSDLNVKASYTHDAVDEMTETIYQKLVSKIPSTAVPITLIAFGWLTEIAFSRKKNKNA